MQYVTMKKKLTAKASLSDGSCIDKIMEHEAGDNKY